MEMPAAARSERGETVPDTLKDLPANLAVHRSPQRMAHGIFAIPAHHFPALFIGLPRFAGHHRFPVVRAETTDRERATDIVGAGIQRAVPGHKVHHPAHLARRVLCPGLRSGTHAFRSCRAATVVQVLRP